LNYKRKSTWMFIFLVIAGMGGPPRAVLAQSQSDFLLFPFAEATQREGLNSDSLLDDEELRAGATLFAAFEKGNFVFLGEALVDTDEQEVERLQFGWRMGGSKAWLGRFHNPIGFWNTQFHHGDFMQTSVSRPAIVEYEDDQGLLPMHLAGLLVEGVREQGQRGLGYAFAVAKGPELGEELSAFDVLRPGSSSGGLALSMNLSLQPTAYGLDQYGLFANYTEIPGRDRGVDEIRQLIAGGYWNWESEKWRLIGSVFYLRNQFEDADVNQSDELGSAYIQVERSFNDRWAAFARVEKTYADDDDRYLELFPAFVREKALVGARANLFERHALKLEISSNREQNDRYTQVMLQWAAMFALE